MEYNINEIRDILNGAENILTPSSIFCNIYNELFINSINFPKNWIYNFGISKLVLIPDESDYVIKIPYKGTFFSKFNKANKIKGYEWDYCLTENTIYYLSKKYHFNKFFAKTKPILKINNYQIYVQERVEKSPCLIYSINEINETIQICFLKNLHCFDSYWLTSVRYYYGEKEMISLLNFLRKYKIDYDLHKDNFGWISGAPVLLDYSGFQDTA